MRRKRENTMLANTASEYINQAIEIRNKTQDIN